MTRMRRYKLKLTLEDFRKRLAIYPPGALREVMRVLGKIEMKKGILYEPSETERDAVHKELIIAQFQEMNATDAEIAELLQRAGLE
jgi:hypothetical protein